MKTKPNSHRLHILIGILGITLVGTLTAIIAIRLNDQALSVLAGAACGVAAAIPTSLLVVAVTNYQRTRQNTHPPAGASYPPVVVVAPTGVQPPTQPPTQSYLQDPYQTYPRQRQTRTFTIVGEEHANERSIK